MKIYTIFQRVKERLIFAEHNRTYTFTCVYGGRHFLKEALNHTFRDGARGILSSKNVTYIVHCLFTSLHYCVPSSNLSCTWHAVAHVHPLTSHANLCLTVLVCMYEEQQKTHPHRGGGRPGWGGGWLLRGFRWWWCKAVTEIEGDGVAAAGCSVHCQSGMINEWRPQLSLTFGEPHRTSAELSAL